MERALGGGALIYIWNTRKRWNGRLAISILAEHVAYYWTKGSLLCGNPRPNVKSEEYNYCIQWRMKWNHSLKQHIIHIMKSKIWCSLLAFEQKWVQNLCMVSVRRVGIFQTQNSSSLLPPILHHVRIATIVIFRVSIELESGTWYHFHSGRLMILARFLQCSPFSGGAYNTSTYFFSWRKNCSWNFIESEMSNYSAFWVVHKFLVISKIPHIIQGYN